jgi:RHS repeat-associated protein
VTPHIVKFTARLIVAALLAAGSAAPAYAQSETIEYYGLDALGSVRVIFDQQGNVVDRMDYGPFGENLRAAIKFPTQQFAQLAMDAETGQDYAQARNYSAGTGRFNRVDPMYAGLFEPQRWNRYTYAANSPLTFSDPSGLLECPPGKFCTQTFGEWDPSEPLEWSEGSLDFFDWSDWCFAVGCGFSFGSTGGTPTPGTSQLPTDSTSTPPDSSVPPPRGPNGPLGEEPAGQLVERPLWQKMTGCAADQLGVSDLVAAGAILAGQPIPGTKPFIIPGSSRGTSLAGMAASRVFGDAKFPVRLPTVVGGLGTGRTLAVAGTKSVARFAGRAVPVIGWAMLGYDAFKIGSCILR